MTYNKTNWVNNTNPAISAENLNKIENELENLDNQINNLEENLSVDYIVEQGTEGIWAYRKWNSGIAECWGLYSEGAIAFSNLWQYAYYSAQLTRNYPTDFFINAPIVASTCQSNAGLNYITVTGNTAASVTYYITSSKAETRTCSVHLYAIGKWRV